MLDWPTVLFLRQVPRILLGLLVSLNCLEWVERGQRVFQKKPNHVRASLEEESDVFVKGLGRGMVVLWLVRMSRKDFRNPLVNRNLHTNQSQP